MPAFPYQTTTEEMLITVLSLLSGEGTADETESKAPMAKQAKCDQSIEASCLYFQSL